MKKNNNGKNYYYSMFKHIDGKYYVQIYKFSLFTTNGEILNYNGKYFRDVEKNMEYNNEIWNKLIKILITDTKFKVFNLIAHGYINAIAVYNAKEVGQTYKIDLIDDLIENDNYNDEKYKMVNSKYIKYEVNENATDMNELFIKPENDYVIQNKLYNSCFLTCIIQNYYKAFQVVKSDGYRRFKNDLTYNYLKQILGINENINKDIGLSINRAIDKFFKPYHLGLDFIDERELLILTYRP